MPPRKKKPVVATAEGSGAATSEDDAGQIPNVALSAEQRRAALLAKQQARKASSEAAAAAEGEEQLLASSSQLNREKVVAEAPAAGLPSGSRSAKSAAPLKSVGQAIEKMKAISNGVLKSALDEGVSASLLCDLMDRTSAYETLLFSLVAENERLRGRLEVLSERASHGRAQQVPVPPAAAPKGGPMSTVSSTPEIPRPVETWSLVVRSKTAAMRMFDFSWNVLGGYGISDHNPIEVCVTHTSTMNESVGGNRWRTRGANWIMHGVFVREEATQVDLGSFRALSVDEQVVLVNRWMTSANDRMFERHRKVNLKRVKWWTLAFGLRVLTRGLVWYHGRLGITEAVSALRPFR
ncbi:hypothetical protein ACLKA6_016352 [Drosophila palustris]